MIRVFISHQSSDAMIANTIARRLRDVHSISSYLDVIDPYLKKDGEDLATYIRVQMAKCTQLLAVVSYSTKNSQWVPWEIGVAAEKEFPLATFTDNVGLVPEFLATWPYLKSMSDLDLYARASKSAQQMYNVKRGYVTEAAASASRYESFFSMLRRDLGQ